jgi:serine/threonine-protein kinase
MSELDTGSHRVSVEGDRVSRRARALGEDAVRALSASGYDVEEPVAAGGFGVVYRARDRRLGREVAVKVLDRGPKRDITAESSGHVTREIETLANLRHPHIVPLFAAGMLHDGLRYFVMPWVEGATLRARLRAHRRLSIDEVLRLGIDLADALSALNEHGLVHRDIKPENVLLEGEHAMVIDFGLVCAHRGQDDVAGPSGEWRVGTPAYMSPEQWDQTGPLDGRADVFSLGCLLYELLTGRSPLEPPTDSPLRVRERNRFRWSETLRSTDAVDPALRHAWRAPPRVRRERADVPASLDRLLQHAMAADASQRLPSAQAFREGLQQVQAARLNGDEGRRTRRTVLLAALAVVVLVPWLLASRLDSLERTRLNALDPQRVLVTTARNATGDAALDPLVAAVSTRVHEALARRLSGSSPFADAHTRLVLESVPERLPAVSSDAGLAAVRPLAEARGGGMVVALEVARVDTGLEVRSALIDARRADSIAPLPGATVPVVASEADLGRVADSVAETIVLALRHGRGGGRR